MKTIRSPRIAVLVAVVLSAACSAGAAFAQVDPPEPDLDSDGVADRIDVCPRTPRGVAPVLEGCAPFEVFAAPPGIFHRSNTLVADALAELDANDSLASSGKKARRAMRLHAAGLDMLGAGDPCGAAATQERFAGKLAKLEERIAAKVTAVARRAQRESDPPSEYGDTPEADLPVLAARVAQATFSRAADSLRADQRSLASLCVPGAAPLLERRRIVSIDDASRRIELENGRVLSVAGMAQRKMISEGMILEILGLDFGGTTGVAVDFGSDATSAKPANLAFECLHFRIVPIQAFPPFSNGPWVTHNPLAYNFADASWPAPELLLERGQRLAVTDAGCPGTTPDAQGQYTRYSAKIDAVYNAKSGPKKTTVASDLTSDDAPVPFAEDLDDYSDQVGLTVTVRKQTCSIFVLQGTPNCSDIEEVRVETWNTENNPTGDMCKIDYDADTFSIDDKDAAAFATTAITKAGPGFWLNGSPLGGDATDFWFESEGYGSDGTTTTWPNPVPLSVGSSLALFNFEREFWQADDPLALAKTGVAYGAGLRFARLHGKRQGHSFWYSCRPPKIVRDVIAYCPDLAVPDTYYRFPFEGGEPDWHLGQANGGTFTHKGKQYYAYDFGADAGMQVLAARGGVVNFVEEDNSGSCWDADAEECVNCTEPNDANVVTVRHQDGTRARYYHAPENGVQVKVGDIVRRGDPVIVVGTTGCSTGNHLHFDVVEEYGTQTVPVTFESTVEDHETCYNPHNDDPIDSTNVQN